MRLERKTVLLFGLLLLLALATMLSLRQQPPVEVAPTSASSAAQPNILFIIIDDMGYSDLGANGNDIVNTPNLDQFAAEGTRFTRNYVNASCTVTRAGILTGMQPELHGFRPDALGISPEVVTLPETLQQAGYSTHHIGKWHLGFLPRLAWPTQQGFETFFGFLAQNVLKGRRNGQWLLRNPTYRNPALQEGEEEPVVQRGHLTDILAARTEQTIATLAEQDTPWFLSVWTSAPHAPIDPDERFAAKYPDTPAGRYLALVEQVDDFVGRMLRGLEANGLAEDTLVMIVSDNGGTGNEIDSNAPFRGGKTTLYEGGLRTPFLLRWPGRVQAGRVSDAVTYYLDYFPTLASVAGAQVPDHLTGLNIIDLLEGRVERTQSLYWEASNSRMHSWSVLSQDGRWRLGQYFFGPPELHDLIEHPAGDKDVAAAHPELVGQLREDYLQWRLRSRVVALESESLGQNGQAKLTGNAFLRAPGYTGYTFGVAVAAQDTDEKLQEGARQTIAYQRDMWQLYLEDDLLHVQVNDVHIMAPAPPLEDCTTILLTSVYNPGHVNPKSKASLLELYVNGELVAVHDTPSFTDPVDSYTNPLFIGQDDIGGTPYLGRLGRPVVLSERLVVEEQNDGKIENGIDRVERELCATL